MGDGTERKEQTPESRENGTSQQTNPTSEARNSLVRLLQVLVPVVGIFTALSYFLGRLRVEAYYNALGITSNVLHFEPQDYMFSSFDLVVMCISASIWLCISWGASRQDRRLVLGFPITRGLKQASEKDLLMLGYALVLCGFLAWNFFSPLGIGFGIAGLAGLNAGSLLGISTVVLTSQLQKWTGTRKLGWLGMSIIIVMLLSYMPSIANRLAELEAKHDATQFVTARVIAKDPLPDRLQSSPQTPSQSIEVKMVLTNGNMTYVLKQDSTTKTKWEVFAIRNDSIMHIVYTHDK